jgi:general secretion pathway protein G
MRRVCSQKAFALIEIMVVVFIVGLLATLVAAKIMHRVVDAKRTAAAADVQAISNALRLFKLDNGFYPAMADGLQILVQPAGKAPNANPDGYLSRFPIDPWGNPYAPFTDGRKFLVKPYGVDGQEGGEGDNADIVNEDL